MTFQDDCAKGDYFYAVYMPITEQVRGEEETVQVPICSARLYNCKCRGQKVEKYHSFVCDGRLKKDRNLEGMIEGEDFMMGGKV